MAETLFLRGSNPARLAGAVADLDAPVSLGLRLLDAKKERPGHVATRAPGPGETWVDG